MLKTLAAKLTAAVALWAALLLTGTGCLARYLAQTHLLWVLLALAWLLTALFAWLVARHLTTPLYRLLKEVEADDGNRPVPPESAGNECERLSRALRTRRAALDEVQAGLHRMTAILDSLPVPIFCRDLSCRYLGVNRSFEEYVGRARADLIGKSVFDIFPPATAAGYLDADRELLARGGVQQYEGRVRLPDGAARDVIFYKAVFDNCDGDPGGVTGTLLDITERKQMESLLAKQKDFSENLMQNLAVPAFVLNDRHEVIIWNRACEELTGVAAAEVIGTRRHWTGFFEEEHSTQADLVLDRDYREADNRYNPLWSRSALIPGGMHGEGWCRNRHGLNGYLMFSSAPIMSRSGEMVAAIETVEDITARKHSEDQLRNLSLAVEQSPSMVVITDTEGTIEYVNQKFVEVTGYAMEEVVGKNPRLLKSGSTPDEQYRELWSTISAGRVWRGEFENKKKGGELYREQAIISPVQDDRGAISHYIALKDDVTERRALEQALRHAQKMDSLGTLTGGVAHDFNNILTAIIGYANLIQMKCAADDPSARFAAQVVASAEKAAVLTRGLLAYSKNQSMNPVHLDLNEVVARVDRLLNRVLGEGIAVVTKLHPEPLRLFADSGHLEQILMNLAVNARDAMPEGGSLTIRTEEFAMDRAFVRLHGYGELGRYALLSVADSGVGLDEATRERIFEPFFTTQGVGGGPGLGLSIVHGIVEQHRGYIAVESAPGQGSVFRVYLPLVLPVSRQAQPGVRQGGGETVLLVEDNPEVRGIVAELLKNDGYQVLEAADSEEGLRRFTRFSGQVALILVDVIMPGKSGLDMYREVRMLDPQVRVLFMSGYSEGQIRAQGALAKDLAFISKPLSPAELLSRVRQVLDG